MLSGSSMTFSGMKNRSILSAVLCIALIVGGVSVLAAGDCDSDGVPLASSQRADAATINAPGDSRIAMPAAGEASDQVTSGEALERSTHCQGKVISDGFVGRGSWPNCKGTPTNC